jgi:hypothetical protein
MEAHFLGLDCPYFTFDSDQHMSYDPWFVQDGENQNHSRNVRVCGQEWKVDHESWVKEEHEGHLYIVAGQWSIASAHGNGKVCAEAKDSVFKTCINYQER